MDLFILLIFGLVDIIKNYYILYLAENPKHIIVNLVITLTNKICHSWIIYQE